MQATQAAKSLDLGDSYISECPLWVKSRHFALQSACPLWANTGHRFIRSPGEQIVRNYKAERLGGLEIDNDLELG
jgi:hypothetical protein